METNKINVEDQTVYIAGPMTGIKDFNFSEFDAASYKWKEKGFRVINPATLTREYAKQKDLKIKDLCVRECAMTDLVEIISRASHMFMLKGWECSKGAKTEHALAEWLSITISYEDERS